MFPCEINEISKNTYFEEYLRTTAFENDEIIFHSHHGTIIRTGITYKKIRCYMRDSACRCFIVKKGQIFEAMLKIFLILAGVRNCIILIGLCNEAFLNCPTIFLDWHNKTKLVQASFSFF